MEPRHVDVLLVGGGVASARCARTLRRRGFGGTILLVGDEPVAPYNRPPLSKELLRGEVPDELVAAEPERWYARHEVELLTGMPVSRLVPADRLAELADGTRLRYGSALLATGAAPRRLAVPGGDAAPVLRTLADAAALRAAAGAGRSVVAVGGGFIGVEASASLAAAGARVTLLEATDALWAGTLGPQLSAWAAERLAGAGVSVRFGARVSAVGVGVSVGGETLPADVVLVGIGVEPRVALAVDAGLEVAHGITVDDRQATSEAGLYAAGDAAHPRGRPHVEHWHAAREGGERAALAMLGEPLPPPRAPWVFSEFAGATLDVFGVAASWDEIVVRGRLHAYVLDGRIVQLAVLDAAVPADLARAFVERRPAPGELEGLPAAG
jgi:3-phenylpropionate/trans-cinnamate dioxygenase ferredoxin reductase subunit